VMALIKPLVQNRIAQADMAVLNTAVQEALSLFNTCLEGIPPGCFDVAEVDVKCKVSKQELLCNNTATVLTVQLRHVCSANGYVDNGRSVRTSCRLQCHT